MFPPTQPTADPVASIRAIIDKVLKPENQEAGPGDVGPSGMQQEGENLTPLTMTEDEAGNWEKAIERSRLRVKRRADEEWDVLLKEYQAMVAKSGAAETVKVNKHFRNVHTKMGQVFFKSPELILSPKGKVLDQVPVPDPQTGIPVILTAEDIVSIKQEVLNQKLGRDGIKVNRLMDELLFDVMAWAGIGCSKLGYTCTFKTIQQPVMGPDPNWQPQAMPQNPLGLAPQAPPQVPQMDPATGQPMMQSVPVPIYEQWYWRRFSPKKMLWNDDLKSTRYDEDATWMGMEFFISPRTAKKLYKLTDDELNKMASDDLCFQYDQDGGSRTPNLIRGVEIFAKATYFRDDEPHPQAMDQIIFIEGRKLPVVYRPSPDQQFDQQGRLTEDSLIGFPFRILTFRDLADSPFPQADAAFTNNGIKQLNTHRRQGVKMRDAAIGKYLYDGSAFDRDTDISNLRNAEVGEYVEVQEGKLNEGVDKIMAITPQVKMTRDDYQMAAIIERDIDETLGITSNTAGAMEQTIRSATETATVNAAISSRNDKEKGRVADFYLDGARMIDSLLMRYATEDDYVHIVGEDGTRKLRQWNNSLIGGKWIYDVAPDSQDRVDTAQDRTQTLTLYNLTAQDPLANRTYLLRRLSRQFGIDPSKFVLNPQTMGMTMGLPPGIQPPHGGPGATVNQHQSAQSGKRPNEPGAENHREQQQAAPPGV